MIIVQRWSLNNLCDRTYSNTLDLLRLSTMRVMDEVVLGIALQLVLNFVMLT